MAHRRTISELSQLVALASGVVEIATLSFAKAVLVPFSLALLLSFLLTPLVRLLEKFRLARSISVGVFVVLSMTAAGLIGVKVTKQLVDVTSQLPHYLDPA